MDCIDDSTIFLYHGKGESARDRAEILYYDMLLSRILTFTLLNTWIDEQAAEKGF
jgi:hypothetical protein